MANKKSQAGQLSTHKHSLFYLILVIIGAAAVIAAVLITVKNYNTEQDANSTVIVPECSRQGSSALACSQARVKQTSTKKSTTTTK